MVLDSATPTLGKPSQSGIKPETFWSVVYGSSVGQCYTDGYVAASYSTYSNTSMHKYSKRYNFFLLPFLHLCYNIITYCLTITSQAFFFLSLHEIRKDDNPQSSPSITSVSISVLSLLHSFFFSFHSFTELAFLLGECYSCLVNQYILHRLRFIMAFNANGPPAFWLKNIPFSHRM